MKNALFDAKYDGELYSGVFGLGGRNIFIEDVQKVFDDALSGKLDSHFTVGLRE